MKIQRFNEGLGEKFYYEGDYTIHFKVGEMRLEHYSKSMLSDKWVEENGIEGVLQIFIKDSSSDNFKSEIDYHIVDNDGKIIDKDIYKNAKKYNL